MYKSYNPIILQNFVLQNLKFLKQIEKYRPKKNVKSILPDVIHYKYKNNA